MDNSNLPPELRNNTPSQDPENSSDTCGERIPLDTLTENSASAEPTYSIFSSKSADSDNEIAAALSEQPSKIGRASCRERV